MKKNLKQIFKAIPEGTDPYIIQTELQYPQPDPETSENFITDYQDNCSSYNLYALMRRGSQVIDIDEELMEMTGEDNIFDYFALLCSSVVDVHLESWARLYYALSLAYNPLYNVDGVTVKTTSEKERTDAYGAQSGGATIGAISTSDTHGARSETLGQHTDTETTYSVSFDNGTEKETGQASNQMGAQTNTAATYTDGHTENARSDTHQEAAHTDKHTDAEYTETEERRGNIGITMSQQLLSAEWELRKKDFFAMIINQLLDEVGFFYDGGIGL